MKTYATLSILFAGLLFVGSAATAIAQTDSQDHDAHHPGETQAAPTAPTGDSPPPAGMQGGMPGMGMMTPEMMQMMQRMMGQMPMAGGMMMCPMMQMMGARPGMEMPSMMGGAMLYGMPHGEPDEMTPERVRALLEQRLLQHGNPRLKLGEVASVADGSVTAEIVTVDGSLVQKLAFNRYPGLFRQIAE